MKENWHNTAATILVIIFGVLFLYATTDGFRAFTEESARVLRLYEEKPQFPLLELEDSKGRTYSFSEFEGKYVMLTFIYTACTDVCPKLELNLAQVYDQIPSKYMGKDVVFLSISFDPERDDVKTLEKYQQSFDSDGETWRMARIQDEQELEQLLDQFGVIVIPDGTGNFSHNSAFYLVDPKGKLVEVLDYKEPNAAAALLTARLAER
ncbi:SCO family protein [Ornithinibacillus gellani]|uniref:SCO family protein n=1 Tax=Ornithinibacillus gellani TaxID=2293253 RepID=UPI000F461D33|nr:SCO family protein [Ornithinibacillus gellani]TQS74812.1 SCO family protein [Ornithinibacillus gellani]